MLLDDSNKVDESRIYVYSDSVLCLEKMFGPGEAIKWWDDQVSTLKMCHTFRELQGLDGEPVDFEWKIFPRSLDFLHEIQADLQGKHVTPEHFSDRIIFMSMFNDIVLEKRGNEVSCAITSRKIKEFGTRRRKQVVSRIFNQLWWQMGSSCFTDFENSGHSIFQGMNPLGRGILKKNNRDPIQFNGEYCCNIDLLYRIVHSANQLCICGAVTKWCGK